jgi:hypothetical protein
MNWEMLAAIGQLTAAAVGIPSIIYLALQIRAQTKERHQSVEFGRVIDAIIARGDKPKAYSTYNLSETMLGKKT